MTPTARKNCRTEPPAPRARIFHVPRDLASLFLLILAIAFLTRPPSTPNSPPASKKTPTNPVASHRLVIKAQAYEWARLGMCTGFDLTHQVKLDSRAEPFVVITDRSGKERSAAMAREQFERLFLQLEADGLWITREDIPLYDPLRVELPGQPKLPPGHDYDTIVEAHARVVKRIFAEPLAQTLLRSPPPDAPG